MENKYYTVGQMAKLSNLSNQTLRYYDQIDLFKPIFIDDKTNYRYYAESQLYLLDLIKSLRFVGTPLDKIKEVQHFSIEELIAFLNMQEKTIEEQVERLQETQYALKKTRKHMEDQLKIPVMEQVYEKFEESELLLCLSVQGTTPEYVSNEEMFKLTETIENTGSVQTIRYGGRFPIKKYEHLNDVFYTEISIPIVTSKAIQLKNEAMQIVKMKQGKYLEIAFVYSKEKYIEMYNRLIEHATTYELAVESFVWEFVMPKNFSPTMEESIIVELKLYIKGEY